MRWLAALLTAVALAGTAAGATGPAAGSAAFLSSRQSANGGFAEQGRVPDGSLTAWAALGLVAAGGFPAERARALEYLRAQPTGSATDADLALRVVALAALGEAVDDATLARLRAHRPGVLVNETIWVVLALRAVGVQPPPALVQAICWRPRRRTAGSRGRVAVAPTRTTPRRRSRRSARRAPARRAVRRALVALASFRNKDGGYALTKGRESDAQSTAWAIQALISAGQQPGQGAVPVPLAPPPERRQLPLLGPVRDDAGLGHGAGGAGARRQAVPAALTRHPRPRRAAPTARRVSSRVVDERPPQRARDPGGVDGPDGSGSPVAVVLILGFLLAAVVGMTSAASPWRPGDGGRFVAAGDRR